MTLQQTIKINYEQVLERIAGAAQSAGRNPAEINLLVVTKGQPLHVVEAAIGAGALNLGENYPKEGVSKIQGLAEQSKVKWHMIGHVQSRKAGLVVEHFDLLHSLDRLKLARKLDRQAAGSGVKLPVMLEFNVSGEASKHGWPAADEEHWPALLPEIAEVAAFESLEIVGLMTLAPFFSEPEQARPYFRRLRQLQGFLSEEFPEKDWSQLSMGMSGDFEAAVQEGATWVRIGTAILGPRSR